MNNTIIVGQMSRTIFFAIIAMVALSACNTTKTDARGDNGDNTSAEATTSPDDPQNSPGESDRSTPAPAPGKGVLAGPSVGALTSVSKGDGVNAPDFTWTDGRGSHKLSDYRGKVVMINFWGTWCPPCRRELPALIKIREDLSRDKFEIIGINISEPVDASMVQSHVADFASEHGIRYPLVIGDDNLVEAYGGVSVVPTTIIVDGNGKMVERIEGSRDEAGFRSVIGRAM